MKTPDEIIEEIRSGRKKISVECNHDLDGFFEFMKKAEKKYILQVRLYEQSLATDSKNDEMVEVK